MVAQYLGVEGTHERAQVGLDDDQSVARHAQHGLPHRLTADLQRGRQVVLRHLVAGPEHA